MASALGWFNPDNLFPTRINASTRSPLLLSVVFKVAIALSLWRKLSRRCCRPESHTNKTKVNTLPEPRPIMEVEKAVFIPTSSCLLAVISSLVSFVDKLIPWSPCCIP